MVEQPVLELLGAGLGVGVVLEVVGQLTQHRVERLASVVGGVVTDVEQPVDELSVQHAG